MGCTVSLAGIVLIAPRKRSRPGSPVRLRLVSSILTGPDVFANTVRSKAIDWLGKSRNSVGNRRTNAHDGKLLGNNAVVDTFRIVCQAQEELSVLDMYGLWHFFEGSAQDVDMLYRQCSELMKFREEDFQLTCCDILTRALREYGQGRLEWEHLIRELIRKGVDLHHGYPLTYIRMPDKPNNAETEITHLMHTTPLDHLFMKTDSPAEAEMAAQNWLSILWSEGLNVLAYLEEEFALHAVQQQMTCPGWCETGRRQLGFQFGASPTVWWEPLLDPESGAYLVLEEFKSMITLWDYYENHGSCAFSERDFVPFDIPDWLSERRPTKEERRENPSFDYSYRRIFAEDRYDCRWKKKASKLARARRTKGPRKVPGAWPT